MNAACAGLRRKLTREPATPTLIQRALGLYGVRAGSMMLRCEISF